MIPYDAAKADGICSFVERTSIAPIKRKYSSSARLGACRANKSSGSIAFFRTSSIEKPIPHTPDGAVLFSCVQGRDRTGMTALMILSALGVSVIDIVDDYMIAPSAEREYFLISLMKNLRFASPDEAAFAKAFASSLLSRFRYAERCPEEEYGSIHTYLTEAIGLRNAEFEQLRKMYLLQSWFLCRRTR